MVVAEIARTRVETFTVTPTGVGRPDYSQNVEYSVEPIVRSMQTPYVHEDVYALLAGETRTVDVAIPSGMVVLLYDFLMSCPANVLLSFQIQTIDADGTVNTAFFKSAYQKVEHHLIKGVPVFQAIRLILTNQGEIALTNVEVSCVGIQLTQQEYYQRIVV